jgi:hypothetical protein
MEEQKHIIVEHLSENSRQMATICTRVTESDERQDLVLTEAKQLAQAMKDRHDVLADLLQEHTGNSRQMLEKLGADQTADHAHMEVLPSYGKEAGNTLWTTSKGAKSAWPPNIDHDAIRTRAMGVLNLMESLPHTPPTWQGINPAELTGQSKGDEQIIINDRESICAKCKKQDRGLLFCDRCPEEVMTLYHPTCLTRIEGKDRVCEHCWETHRESTGSSETTQTTINDDESAQVLHKDTDIPKSTMTEVRKTTEAEDSDSSDTSTTVSD